MSEIISYGYIGFTAPDVDEWRTFAADVMGMSVADGPEDGQILLRMDERVWRMSVEPGDGGLAFSGFEVPDAPALARLVATLEADGVATKNDPALAAKRGVNGLVTCHDPAGNRIEFFHGALLTDQPFRSPTGVQFVTSKPGWGQLSFGHAVILVPDEAAAKHFYLDLLGFRLSDTIDAGPGNANFIHVNPRHHSLAFAEVEGMDGLNHIMVEVADIDMVGHTMDIVQEKGIPILQSLGRHTNDKMLSFYIMTPSGFFLEYGCDGLLIDDRTWTTSSYTSPSVWGHQGEFPDGTVDI